MSNQQLAIKIIDSNSEVLELRNRILRLPIGLNLFEENLAHEKNDIVFGAFEHEKLIGCVMLKPISNNIAKLRQMSVDNEYQGKGIGRQLVVFFEDYCKQNNYQIISLHARDNAIGFYEKLGYKVIGENFLEVGIEHFKMQKEIT